MFLPIDCMSVNKRNMVGSRQLTGVCSYFQFTDKSAVLLLFEYICVESNTLVACDVVIKTFAGEIFAHDYLLLDDGSWRDSFGEVAEELTALLPTSMLTAKCIKTEPIEEFSAGE